MKPTTDTNEKLRAPILSIITSCKGRLEHLKQSLPSMLDQDDCEVVVVDFSCPQGVATYVQENFPSARVACIPDRTDFAICEARNAGAAHSTGKWLAFVDADTILTPNALSSFVQTLPAKSFAKFGKGSDLKTHKLTASVLSKNSLRGFMVVEREVFEKMGGYDAVLKGYGAGGDVEFDYRLTYFGYNPVMLPETIVTQVLDHDNALRLKYSGLDLMVSYIRGRVYFQIKRTVLGFFHGNIPPVAQQSIYDAAVNLTKQLGGGTKISCPQLQIP